MLDNRMKYKIQYKKGDEPNMFWKKEQSKRRQIKKLILESKTFYDVDRIITFYGKFETYEEKIAFLKGMFDFEIYASNNGVSPQKMYFLMVNSIIKK